MAEATKDARRPVPDAHGITPMWSDAQLRALRIAVVVMGAILLVGFAVVIGRLVYLLNRAPVDGTAKETTAPASLATGARASLALPAGAHVRGVSLSGNRLAVHYEWAGGTGIAIVDVASGQVVSRIDVAPEAAR